MQSAPDNSMILLEDIPFPHNLQLVFNKKGLQSDPLVAISLREKNCLFACCFPEKQYFLLKAGREDELIPLKLDPDDLEKLSKIHIDAHAMSALTGKNEPIPDGAQARVCRTGRDSAQYMAYGRHYWIAPGKYTVKYNFESITCAAEKPSVADVASDRGRIILAKKELAGEKTEELKFDADEVILIEPRIYYGGEGEIVLKSIEIEKD
jgi:hypothetical protein